jgi:hypothetical protein
VTLRASGISRRCDVMRATGICDCTGIVVVTAPGKPAAKFAGGMSRWPKIRVWFCVSDNGGVRVMGRLEFSGRDVLAATGMQDRSGIIVGGALLSSRAQSYL